MIIDSKKRAFRQLFMLIVITAIIKACSFSDRKPFFQADISDIRLDTIIVRRYEQVLFSRNPYILKEELMPYMHDYALFLGSLAENDRLVQQLHDFVTDHHTIDLYLDSQNITEFNEVIYPQLLQAFRYYLYHFPGHEIPQLFTYISGVDYMHPVKYDGERVIIALDVYLGPNYPLYDRLGIPRYYSRWMIPESILVDVAGALADEFLADASSEAETLLEHMIIAGKRHFVMDCLLPNVHDSLKIKYTGDHMEWIGQYKAYAWTYKLDNDLLYTTDMKVIQQFISTAPFTSSFSSQSAPRTGVWIGWQIVREFMKRHPETSLQELLTETDAQKILTASRYRP
ncbi:MAG: hypothetical protein RG741_03035 [Bacteroidales bacterium]|nr:hypothetical protein [Bacteroidales bacterium]